MLPFDDVTMMHSWRCDTDLSFRKYLVRVSLDCTRDHDHSRPKQKRSTGHGPMAIRVSNYQPVKKLLEKCGVKEPNNFPDTTH